MLIRAFTIWACNEYLRSISENSIFDNHESRFLWPQKLQAHRLWRKEKPVFTGTKLSYIPVTTKQQVEQIMALDGLVVYIDTRYRATCSDYDITVTGVNSIRACALAMDFVVNQLVADELPSQTCLALLPSAAKYFGKSVRH